MLHQFEYDEKGVSTGKLVRRDRTQWVVYKVINDFSVVTFHTL